MLKFLFYLFISYVVFRFIFGRLLGTSVKTKVFRFETHHHYHGKREEKKDGHISVDPRTIRKDKDDRNLGEYVDYEEIK